MHATRPLRPATVDSSATPERGPSRPLDQRSPGLSVEDWERALVEGLVARRPDAWRSFLQQYGALVKHMTTRGFVACGVMNAHDVEDAVSLFYERVLVNDARRLRAFDPSLSRLSTWIGNIARQSAVEYARANRRDRTRSQPLPAPEVVDPEAEAVRAEAYERMSLALQSLADADRALLVASYLEDVPLPSLAARFALSEKTIYSKRCRLRARLCALAPLAA